MFRADLQCIESSCKIQVKIENDIAFYRKITRLSDGHYNFSAVRHSIVRESKPKYKDDCHKMAYILVDRHRYYLQNFERLVW